MLTAVLRLQRNTIQLLIMYHRTSLIRLEGINQRFHERLTLNKLKCRSRGRREARTPTSKRLWMFYNMNAHSSPFGIALCVALLRHSSELWLGLLVPQPEFNLGICGAKRYHSRGISVFVGCLCIENIFINWCHYCFVIGGKQARITS